MEEVVGSAAVEVGKCACAPLKEHAGYLTHFHNKVKDLKDRVQDLRDRKEHIDRLVSTGCSNGEEETPEVRRWLTRAAKMIQEAETIQPKEAENKGCVRCLNLKWRYSKSKQAKQMTDSIVTHCDNGNPDKMKMTMPPSLPTVINEEAPSIEGLPSVESSLQEVMSALRDENTKIIGVTGMGGVGKTTLVDMEDEEGGGEKKDMGGGGKRGGGSEKKDMPDDSEKKDKEGGGRAGEKKDNASGELRKMGANNVYGGWFLYGPSTCAEAVLDEPKQGEWQLTVVH